MPVVNGYGDVVNETERKNTKQTDPKPNQHSGSEKTMKGWNG
jgi:hypothetical protein